MRSLSPHSRLTQLLEDRIDESGAIRVGWITARRVERKGVLAIEFSGEAVERGHSAVSRFRRLRDIPEAGAGQIPIAWLRCGSLQFPQLLFGQDGHRTGNLLPGGFWFPLFRCHHFYLLFLLVCCQD